MTFPLYFILLGAELLLTSIALRPKVTGPFGPPYPITAAWFQDKYTKSEWNKSLSEFADIGGDTVMLRAPPVMLTTEDQLLQDPEFQVILPLIQIILSCNINCKHNCLYFLSNLVN